MNKQEHLIKQLIQFTTNSFKLTEQIEAQLNIPACDTQDLQFQVKIKKHRCIVFLLQNSLASEFRVFVFCIFVHKKLYQKMNQRALSPSDIIIDIFIKQNAIILINPSFFFTNKFVSDLIHEPRIYSKKKNSSF